MKNIKLLRLKHTAKLEKLIRENAPYDEILEESEKLDKLINEEMKNQIKYKQNE